MSPLSKEQLSQIRDERKDQIMRAALKVFARRGIDGTKISMIVAEAGVSQGLFYHYFKSKDEALIALVQEAIDISYSATKSLRDLPIAPLEKIRFLTQSILNDEGKYYFLLIYQARMSDDLPDRIKELFSEYSMKAYVDLMRPIFEEGQRSGDIAAGDLEEIIASYFTILSGVMVVNAKGDGVYRIPDVDTIMRLVTK
ncbi:TetR/AcrR family transcriptional regulator [Cohnella caldifontis]|uniref:TetR/AcrR family transcriptional regulator n=1 Tax=Cohnella caldifontis TaxID=3027471 RepID=UPI0023EBCC70|nr:TetR/AcrR family transcriptional regulator [Cohnella sp. YIM B05605]